MLIKEKRVINLAGKLQIGETAYIIQIRLVLLAMIVLSGSGCDACRFLFCLAQLIQFWQLHLATMFSVVGNSDCMFCYDPREGLEGRMYNCDENICLNTLPLQLFSNIKATFN